MEQDHEEEEQVQSDEPNQQDILASAPPAGQLPQKQGDLINAQDQADNLNQDINESQLKTGQQSEADQDPDAMKRTE